MGRGQWTRWGRGMCEGWSLEIGVAFHGSVVRRNPRAEPTNWMASVNSTGLGECPQREIAMRRVEEIISPACSWCCTIGKYIERRKRDDTVRQSAPLLRLFGNQNPIEVRAKLRCAEICAGLE